MGKDREQIAAERPFGEETPLTHDPVIGREPDPVTGGFGFDADGDPEGFPAEGPPVEPPLFDLDQERRVAALRVAREAVSDVSGVFNNMAQGHKVPKHIGTAGLIRVAAWIVDGVDPVWDS